MNELKKEFQKYGSLLLEYRLHPSFGFLLPPDYKPTFFNYDEIYPFVVNIGDRAQSVQEIKAMVDEMPEYKIKEEEENESKVERYWDMIIIHDMTAYIVHIWNFLHRVQSKENVVPFKIAKPLEISSECIGTKLGMHTGITFNWIPTSNSYLTDPDNFTYESFNLRWQLSPYSPSNVQNEKLFLGGSVIAAFYLSRVNKLLWEANLIIQKHPQLQNEVCERLEQAGKLWEKINIQNRRIPLEFDNEYFWNLLRPRLQGWKQVEFEGFGKTTSGGGAGGGDPSFQIYERRMGLTFQGDFKQTQQQLLISIPSQHRKFIQSIEKAPCYIRKYCSLSQSLISAYNSSLIHYKEFLRLHSTFIQNFIHRNLPPDVKMAGVGTAGISLQKLIYRYKEIEKQFLKDVNFDL